MGRILTHTGLQPFNHEAISSSAQVCSGARREALCAQPARPGCWEAVRISDCGQASRPRRSLPPAPERLSGASRVRSTAGHVPEWSAPGGPSIVSCGTTKAAISARCTACVHEPPGSSMACTTDIGGRRASGPAPPCPARASRVSSSTCRTRVALPRRSICTAHAKEGHVRRRDGRFSGRRASGLDPTRGPRPRVSTRVKPARPRSRRCVGRVELKAGYAQPPPATVTAPAQSPGTARPTRHPRSGWQPGPSFVAPAG